MKSMSINSRRVLYIAAACMMAVVLVLPAIVSAAQVTERSIELSNSSVSSTGVTYGLSFTSVGSAGAFVVDFCANTPLIGQECTAPAGFTSAAAATSTPNFSINSATANRVVVEGAIAAETAVEVTLTGITNPSASGPLYARIVTYDTAVNAAASTPQNLGTGAEDDGSVAISITDTIGVSGTVLETLTFCTSKTLVPDNCQTVTPPLIKLGEQVGDTFALSPGVVSDDNMFVQISTNASSGAVVRLKSNAVDCGGLLRAGAPTACDILPALNADIDPQANEAKFGVKTATATDTPSANANGALAPVSGSFYNPTTYALNYIEGNATGITSTFGDPFLDTANAPASGKNMEITFGATVSNNTPAGSYSTDLSMIAVGKF